VEAWLEDIATPEGGEHFLLDVVASKPELFTETVLVDIALRVRAAAEAAGEPDPFAAAMERAAELAEDRRALRVHEGERDQRVREHREERARTTSEQQQQKVRAAAVEKITTEEAGKVGVRKAESLQLVRDSVDAMLRRAAKAGTPVNAAALRAHVQQVGRQLLAERADAAKVAKRAAMLDQQGKVRKAAAGAKNKRTPPAGTAAPQKGGAYKPPAKNADRMGALVDSYFD
jgi:hypothetical protein